jgi:hypothetical protein
MQHETIRHDQRSRDGLGAAVTAILFVIGKFALGIYLGKGSQAPVRSVTRAQAAPPAWVLALHAGRAVGHV